jgi:hypothetical protein
MRAPEISHVPPETIRASEVDALFENQQQETN